MSKYLEIGMPIRGPCVYGGVKFILSTRVSQNEEQLVAIVDVGVRCPADLTRGVLMFIGEYAYDWGISILAP